METVTPVRKPIWAIEYETKDITAQLAPYVLSVSYTDHLEGESDEVEIVIEDSEQRWKNNWYPSKGDKVSMQIGYESERLIPCGDFQVDEIELSGPPDTATLRCLAAGIIPSLRTKTSRAYEGKTLRQIAGTVAAANGFEATGIIEDFKIGRVTQNQEHDLQFLKRISDDYGYVFSIRGGKLIFHQLEDLQNMAVVCKIDKKDMASFNLKDKTSRIYKSARVSYFDPKTKKVHTASAKNKDVKGGDTLVITERCENKAQAMTKAKSALKKANVHQVEGSISMQGEPRLLAGNNIEVTGLGKLTGFYQVKQSRHTIDRSAAYSTSIEVISHA